jgi:hypothetical protein
MRKLSKKIALLIMLLISVPLLLGGCGLNTTSPDSQSSQTSTNQLHSEPTESTVTVPKTQTYFYNGKDFSNGVAWVQRNASYWECIDNKGKTLFFLGADSVPLTDFTDGGALIETTDSKNVKGEKIIDKSGTVVFPQNDGYQYNFIISYGNYNFVERNINTFEKTEDQIGIVDNAGKWVLEPTPDLTVPNSWGKTDHGIISVSYHDNTYYDAQANKFFKSPENYKTIQFSNSEQEGLVFRKYGDRNTKNGFYDKNDNKVIDLSSYDSPESVGGFSGGYCTVMLKNPQGSVFYTVFDNKGNRMFEPISQKLSKVSCGRILVESKNGNPEYYIDVNGKTVIPDITNGSDFSENGLAKIGISNAGSNGVYYIDTDGNIAFYV